MTVTSKNEIGWKAASTTGVVAAGIRILDDGGNAADAAVATIFALNVTDHGDCSIGGKVPLLIYDTRNQEVKALSGQGRAPRFSTAHHQDSFDPNRDRIQTFKGAGSLTVSDSVDDSVKKELSRRRHKLDVKTSPIASPVMLYVDQDSGVLYAAGDPKAFRHAAGLTRK